MSVIISDVMSVGPPVLMSVIISDVMTTGSSVLILVGPSELIPVGPSVLILVGPSVLILVGPSELIPVGPSELIPVGPSELIPVVSSELILVGASVIIPGVVGVTEAGSVGAVTGATGCMHSLITSPVSSSYFLHLPKAFLQLSLCFFSSSAAALKSHFNALRLLAASVTSSPVQQSHDADSIHSLARISNATIEELQASRTV